MLQAPHTHAACRTTVLRVLPPGLNAQRYLNAMLAAIESDLGGRLPLGTSIVAADDRAGSGIATCYPFGNRTAVWCDPELTHSLARLVGSTALSAHEFTTRAVDMGAALRGIGLNRVLDGPLVNPRVDVGPLTIRTLDRHVDADVALTADLRAAVSDADAEEADFDVDHLDPHIVAAVESTPTGRDRLLAFASARLADSVPFDDIGIITHPAARQRGLGLACVHRLIELRQASDTPAMYRCEADNTGSDRIAQRLGFALVQTVGSVRFGA